VKIGVGLQQFRVTQEITVAESISGDKFPTQCRINALSAHAEHGIIIVFETRLWTDSEFA